MATGAQLEIMVKDVPVEEAKKRLRDHTDLDMNHVKVTEYIDTEFRYLCGMSNSDKFPRRLWFKESGSPETDMKASTVGGYLETPSGDCRYAITSGHYSGKDVPYFDSSTAEQQCIGTCKQHFFEDNLDMALVKLNSDIPKQRMVNILELPHGNHFQKYVPRVWKGNLNHEAQRLTPVLKHGPRGLAEGKLIHVLVKKNDLSTDFKKYIAIMMDNWQAGTCWAGDSGSLVTSVPDGGLHVNAYGIVSGLIVSRCSGNCERQYCVVSPLWPALERIRCAQGKQIELKFVHPVMHPSDYAEQASAAADDPQARQAEQVPSGSVLAVSHGSLVQHPTPVSDRISHSTGFTDIDCMKNAGFLNASDVHTKGTSVCDDSDQGFVSFGHH